MNHKIAILLTTYNGEKYLVNQLESLFAQSIQNFCVIIRDDGSIDNTLQIIDDYQTRFPEKIILLKDNSGNLGSVKSFLTLLDYMQAPYIMFCDQDDIWMSDKIALTIAKMDELEGEYGSDTPLLVFSDMKVVDSNLSIIHDSFWEYQKLDPAISQEWKKLLAQNVITGCTIMINQAAKEVSLPFAIDTMMHDQWIGVNVAKYGKITYLDTSTVLYRQHGANVDGAHQYNWNYVLNKIKNITKPISKLYLSSNYFNVPFFELFFYKFTINLKRFLGRS